MQVRTIGTHEDQSTEERWSLIQYDDGALYVQHDDKRYSGDHKLRMVSINAFMREGGSAPEALQILINRMFVYA